MSSLPRSLALALLAAAALVLVALWPAGDGLGGARRHAVETSIAGHDASDAERLTLIRPAEEGAARETAAEAASDPESAARARRTATVEVVVRARGSGAPVAHANAWVVDDSFRSKRCDDSGRAVFDVLPGETLVGCEPPEGSSLLEILHDPETGELASEANVTLAAGERGTVRVELFPGATIRGIVSGPDGAAVENFPFVLVPPRGERWGKPRPVRTDTTGRFVVAGLERGTYLVGPYPHLDDVFPIERPTVEWGATADLDLRLATSHATTVRATILQAGTSEPWPLPATVFLRRADGLDEVVARLPSGGLQAHGLSPVEAAWTLRPGPHYLQVSFQGNTSGRACRILDSWYDERLIHVDDDTDTVEVEVTSPRVERLTHVRGFLSRPFARPDSELVARAAGGNGDERPLHPSRLESVLDVGGSDVTGPDVWGFDVWIDLDHAQFDRLEIVQRAGGHDTVLAVVALQPGTQEVTVTPTGGA